MTPDWKRFCEETGRPWGQAANVPLMCEFAAWYAKPIIEHLEMANTRRDEITQDLIESQKLATRLLKEPMSHKKSLSNLIKTVDTEVESISPRLHAALVEAEAVLDGVEHEQPRWV